MSISGESDASGGMSAGTDGGYSTSGTSPNSSSASEPAPAEPQDWDAWSSDATNFVIDQVKGAVIDLGESALGIPEYAGKVLGLETDNPQFMKDVDPATGLPRTDAGASDTPSATPPADAGHAFDLSTPAEAVSAVNVGEISPNFVDGEASSTVGPIPMNDGDLDAAPAESYTLGEDSAAPPSEGYPTLGETSEPVDVEYPLGETSAPSIFDGHSPTLGRTSPPDVEYPLGETSAPSTFSGPHPTLGETSAPVEEAYPLGETSGPSTFYGETPPVETPDPLPEESYTDGSAYHFEEDASDDSAVSVDSLDTTAVDSAF